MALPATRAGFEGLIAELVEAASGGRLALMSSGDQGGVDAIGASSRHAPRRAMQAKRYADTTPLDLNHLLGEMDRAQMKFAGLDCWVLATTRPVHGKELDDLGTHAGKKAWGLVVLDWTETSGLPKLAVLCAAYRQITDRYLTDNEALAALDELAKHPGFRDAVRQTEHDLRAPEVGFEPAREAASAQMERVFTDRHAARRLAGASPTFLSQAPPVARPSVDRAIRDWWYGPKPVLALLGDEGVGKSWAALGAMRALGAAPGGPIVVTIPSSVAVKTEDSVAALADALARSALAAGWSSPNPGEFWRRRIDVWAAGREARDQSAILLLVDGLDELEPFDWNSWLAPVLEASLNGLVRTILACRRDDWARGAKPSDLKAEQYSEVLVGSFEPSERDLFLQSQGVDITRIARKVLEAALHPRTAFHVARLGAEIGDLSRITREQILLRDFQNRHEIKGGPLDPDAFEQVVIRMAREAEAAAVSQSQYRPAVGEVVDLAVEVTGHDRGPMRRVLSELVAGGWVERTAKSSTILGFTDTALPLAVGIALADWIQDLPLEQAIAEVDRLLEPWSADDLVEPVLRMCATVVVTRGASDPICREVLRRWADLRFHDRDAQEFWRRLQAFKPELFLDMVEIGATGSNWLGEWGVACLWEDQPDCIPLVEARIQRWLSRIGLPRQRARADATHQAISNRERTQQLRRLEILAARGEVGWSGLLGVEIDPGMAPFHRALRTIGFLPRAPFVSGLVAWALANAVAGRRYGDVEVAAVLRDNSQDWASANAALHSAVDALMATGVGLARTAAALLLEATGEPDDAARGLDLRPRRSGTRDRSTLVLNVGQLELAADYQPVNDRIFIAELMAFVTDPDIAVSEGVGEEVARIASAIPADDIYSWLSGDRPLITPLLRWAPAITLAKLHAFIEEGRPGESEADAMYDATVQSVFPVLSPEQRAQAARSMLDGDAPSLGPLITMQLLTLPFREQISLLAGAPRDAWPERADTLLRIPTEEEFLEELLSLDLDGEAPALRSRLSLLAKVREHRRPEALAVGFDWRKAFAHDDPDVRRSAFDIADSVGGEPAARALSALDWAAEGRDPIEAYEGSMVLGALNDTDLAALVPRISGENALSVAHQRPSLCDAADERIWRWIEQALEVRRTSHSMGATFCIYTRRDEAFAEFVGRHLERVHETLERVWSDKGLRGNLSFDDGDSPGWPLLKALASSRPDFVKRVWREAVGEERGFSFSSINTFPTELPVGSEFDDVRLEMLDDVHVDDRLFGQVRSLQSGNHFAFLRDLIVSRLQGPRPYDRAWAMTASGFLIPTDEAIALWRGQLSASPGAGWLGDVHARSKESFDRAISMRYWYERLGDDVTEGEAWIVLRIMQLTVDERYVDLIAAPPHLFENRPERVSWLNFLSPEEKAARKRATKALSDTWLRGQRYRDVINGR